MLTKTSLQTVRALVELARLPEGRWEGAAALARKTHAPANYLGKVLQSLVPAGLVLSQRGLRGGFRLGRDSSKISLFDVVDPIENTSRWSGCVLGQRTCSDRVACSAHRSWSKTRKVYIDFLKNTTLKELAK